MKRFAIVICFFVFVLSSVQAKDETASITPSLFGYSIGQPWKEIEKVRSIKKKVHKGKNVCVIPVFHSGSVEFTIMIMLDDKLSSVMIDARFDSDNYKLVKSALSQKYGEPIEKSEIITNRLGMSFEQKISTWTFKNSEVLKLKKYAGKITRGEVSLISNKTIDYYDEDKEKKVEELKNDL